MSIDSISTDSGVMGDFITNDADGLTVNASLSAALGAGEKLFYSNDNGATWIDVTSAVNGTAVSYVDDALTSSTTVQFRVVDAAGNTGSLASQAIVIDNSFPTVTVSIDSISTDSGVMGDFITNDADGLTVNANLSAALGAGEKLFYSNDNGATWIDVTSSVNGTAVSYVDDALTSSTTVQFRVVDAAGNAGSLASQAIVIDTVAPTTTVSIDSISLESGVMGDFITNDADGLTVNASLSAALGAGEKLFYSNDNGATWVNVTSSVTGTAVSYVDDALTSSTTVQFRVEDAAGNAGSLASQAIVIDNSFPTVNVSIDSISFDSGVAGDFITNDADGLTVNASLSAALGAGEKLFYSNDNGATWINVTSAVNGTAVSYVDDALTSSSTVQFRVVDTAGNAGSLASQVIVIDTAAPTTTVVIDSISLESGVMGDFITNDADGLTVNASLSAALGAGEKLFYSNDNGATWIDVTSSVTGTAVSYVDDALTSSTTVQFRVEDAAGNAGSLASQAIVIDNSFPTVNVSIDSISFDSGVAGDFITNDADGLTVNASLSAALGAGEKLFYSNDNGATWVNVTSSVNGTAVSYVDDALTSSTTVQFRVVDAAGNAGSLASQAIVIDTVAPTTSVAIDSISLDTGVAGDFITSDSDGLTVNASLSAALGAGEKLFYSNDNGATWIDVTSSVNGTAVSYVDDALTGSPNAVHTGVVKFRVEDAAGNAGSLASQVIVIDTAAPTTSVAIDSISLDTGVAGDFITSDSDGLTVNASLSAALAAGEKLFYSNDNGATWIDVTSSVTGTAVSYVDDALTSSTTVQFRVVDAAGNAGSLASQVIVIDSVAPSMPVAPTTYADDVGSVKNPTSTALVTDDTRPGINVGAGLTGAPKLYVNGSLVSATYDSVAGTLTPDVGLADGTYAFTWTLTDVAGNESAPSGALNVSIATSVETLALSLRTDSGSSAVDGITNVSTVDVTGIVAGNTWEYSVDGGASWIAGADKTFELLDGKHSYLVRQTDMAGNVSQPSSSIDFTLDKQAPVPLVVSGPEISSTYINAAEAASDGGTEVIIAAYSGMAEGDVIDLDWAGVHFSHTVTASEVGQDITFLVDTATLNAHEGLLAVTYSVTDIAGNSAGSPPLSVLVDTTPPAFPKAPVVIDSTNGINASEAADGVDVIILPYSVMAEGDQIDLLWQGTHYLHTVTQAEVDAGKGITLHVDASAISDGTFTLIYDLKDSVGNPIDIGNGSVSTSVTVDLTAPGAPNLVLATDTGSSNSDKITNVGTVNVSGLEAGATWQYSTNGGSTWTAGSGTSFTLSGDGAKSVVVRQTDAAGNVSVTSAPYTFTLDTNIAVPTIDVMAVDNDMSAAEASKAQNITGKAEAGASVTINFNGYDYSAVADASGNWGVVVPAANLTGAYAKVITVTATDAAGNVSAPATRSVWLSASVNTTASGDQVDGNVTNLADGGWVVTWKSSQDIYQQRYTSAGVASGVETLVNSTTLNGQQLPSVTGLSDGGWVVTWISFKQDGSADGIYQQRYTSAGVASGAETQVNTYTANIQSYPSVTGLSDGGWVVTWSSLFQETGWGVYQQRYTSTGVAVG
ncbi:beta strand repeat-containing protein, partial [Pseudomonas sp. NPDC090755]|uniref:beta strand repeat-containing protein n=1 Tax=Pseudomonas sp. NPDC090755 TaxID=3364481 RepID=UPI00383A60D5